MYTLEEKKQQTCKKRRHKKALFTQIGAIGHTNAKYTQ